VCAVALEQSRFISGHISLRFPWTNQGKVLTAVSFLFSILRESSVQGDQAHVGEIRGGLGFRQKAEWNFLSRFE
jgi:hypothetical protein